MVIRVIGYRFSVFPFYNLVNYKMYRVQHKKKRREPRMSVGGDVLNWLLGKETVRFKGFLKQHGQEEITSLQVGRVPISKAVNLGMDLLTGGAFEKAKKDLSVDNFFHLFIVLNHKYVIEKNQDVNQKPHVAYPNEETMDVPLNESITIEQLIETASKGNEQKFWLDYNPLQNNCQQWVSLVLRKNGLDSSSVSAFVNQDMKKLLERLPGYTSHVGKAITDVASVINRILQLTTGGVLGFATGGMLSDSTIARVFREGRKLKASPKGKSIRMNSIMKRSGMNHT